MSDGDGEPQTWSTAFGELEFDDDDDERDEPTAEQRRRNSRALTIAIALGSAVVLAIAVVGVVLVRGYLDETTSLTARMSLKYHAQYRSCLERTGDRATCATRAEASCAADAGWGSDPRRLDDVVDTCLFGDDAVR